jgi:Zn-dependent peptidase ImmA (M78 family)
VIGWNNMGNINLENILFIKNNEKFLEVERKANTDILEITKQQKVKDEIFSILKRLDDDLHLLIYPIEDDELSAFTVFKNDKSFIYINSYQNLNLQIFAAAHEFYHYKYDRKDKNEVLKNIEAQFNGDLNEMMANSYAACFLVPKHLLLEQVEILKIDRNNVTLQDILLLMDTFAVPFKAMVLRLFETEVILKDQAEKFLEIPTKDIILLAKQKQIALKWFQKTNDPEYGRLLDLALQNFKEGSMTTFKIIKDFEKIGLANEIKELLSE